MDSMLSLDLGPNDCLYRIRRASETVNLVVYVTVTNLAIIPEEDRTYGPFVIKELSKLKEWTKSWTTLRVNMEGDRIWCETDAFPHHAVPKEHVHSEYPVYEIFSFDVRRSVNHRVSEVLRQGQTCFLKIARFPHELPFLIREMEAYHSLCLADACLAPKLIGYVFEESPDRVVGFLMEAVQGRVAGVEDLPVVTEALGELHRVLIHGDFCKYNIYITSDGPKFIDFEFSTPIGEATASMAEDELKALPEKLADESGAGRP
jgi:hypothetical protein